MTSHWDEFSKSLAEESLPRRESLRRLGALFTGAVLSPLGVGTAWAAGKPAPDPCKAFCKCRSGTQQNACLAACNACNKDTRRLCGSCGTYVCSDLMSDPNCAACGNDCRVFGQTCCVTPWRGPQIYCADLAEDFYNCGGCGVECADGEVCVGGLCECEPLLTRCNGACTDLDSDPDNCGACGNVCSGSAPHCVQGECTCPANWGLTPCGNSCVDLSRDRFNCGACGDVCGPDMICEYGACTECAPELTFCTYPGYPGYAYCADLLWDSSNCGACGHYCSYPLEYCSDGLCNCPSCGGGDYWY